jgi:hypothetical protein
MSELQIIPKICDIHFPYIGLSQIQTASLSHLQTPTACVCVCVCVCVGARARACVRVVCARECEYNLYFKKRTSCISKHLLKL